MCLKRTMNMSHVKISDLFYLLHERSVTLNLTVIKWTLILEAIKWMVDRAIKWSSMGTCIPAVNYITPADKQRMGSLLDAPCQDSQKSLHICAGAHSSCLNLCFTFSEMLLRGCIFALLLLPLMCQTNPWALHPQLLPPSDFSLTINLL